MTGLLDFLGYGNMPNGGASGLLSGGPFDEMDALRQGAASAPPGAALTPGAANAAPTAPPIPNSGGGYDRFAGPPTVTSTGGPTPILRPGSPMSAAPTGSVPQMGMGEYPTAPPMRPDEYGRDTPPGPAPAAPATADAPPGPMQGGAVPFLNQGQQAQAGNPTGGNPTAPTDVSSSNRQPAPLPPANTPGGRAAQLPGMSQGGLLDRIQSFLDSHRNQISNFGAGLASGGGWAKGLGQGARAAVAGRQQDETENSTYQALVGKGMDPQQAMAAVRNPQVLKQLLPQIYSTPEAKTTTDWLGNQKISLVNPVKGTVSTPVNAPVDAPKVSSFEQALRLPPGTQFIDPNGNLRTR